MDIEELARKHALENAVEFEGDCNPGAVIGKVIAESDADPEEAQEVSGRVCAEVNELSLEEQKEEMESYEYEEEDHIHDPIPDLPGAEEGEVTLRFAPNPNGPPHIGHARGMVINGELRDKYSGSLVLRFDDTDPRKKRPLEEAYDWYQEDYEWLGYTPDEVVYSSKQFDKYYRHAEKLVEMGKAYVCRCSAEEGREYRSKGEPCPHRDTSPESNLAEWKDIKTGDTEEGEAVLKIKTDLDHKNPAVRDFVAFRIIEDPDHPVTGNQHKAWPLLDFAGAIEDHYTNTTHIVRGKDLRASTKRQRYIYDYLDWEYPEVRYWGNVQISGFNAPVSGSKLSEMIESGELEGWDDPRAPTLKALRKRGFQPEAIQEFFIEMGVSENDVEASVETLESANRDVVEDSDRYFFVKQPVKLEISGLPEDVSPEMPLHPDHPGRGSREPDLDREDGTVKVLVEEDDLDDGFLRLKGFCNVEIEGKEAEYEEGDHTVAVEEDAPIIHWVPASAKTSVVVMPDAEEIEGRIEPNSIDEDEVVQFERFGFARRDENGKFYFAHE